MFDYALFNLHTFNRKGFSDMYDLCFGQTVKEDYFKWKYQDNPAGKMIGFTASESGIVAGFYGVIPENYLISGKPCVVYQSMDTMTHPSFQKKGLFTALAEKTYGELDTKDSRTFIIGIPGSNSYYGFVHKLNWKSLHHFSFTFIHRSVFKALTFLTSLNTFAIKKIDTFFDASVVDFLNASRKKDNKIRPVIDSDFLNWRIKKHPHIHYESLGFYDKEHLKGIVIHHTTENATCFIDWLETTDEQDTKIILRSFCKHIFSESSFQFIYSWKPLNAKYSAAYRRAGFITNYFKKGPFSYKVPFIIYSKTNEINGVNLLDIHNYDLQPIIQD